MEEATRDERLVRWTHHGRCGAVVVEVWHLQPDHIQVYRFSGAALPARLLGPVLDAALGPQWRELAAGEPRVDRLHSGRIRVWMRNVEGAIRLSRSLRLEDDVYLPIYALAAMVGPQGLGGVLPDHEPWAWEIEVR